MSAAHCLVLYPASADWTDASLAALRLTLEKLGLIGREESPGVFLSGTGYLGLITYLGCSPQIALGEAEAATRVRLHGPYAAPGLLMGENPKTPRCRQCRHELTGGKGGAAWLDKTCPHCGQPLPFGRIDWRRSAAYGRVFIEISNVYESEAVPSDSLLDGLREFSGTAWDYAYLRGPLSISGSTRAF